MALCPVIQDNSNASRLMRYCSQHKDDECKVLNKKEEQELIAKYRDNLPLLRQKLIMHNVGMVFDIASKWMGSCRSFDDLVQRGFTGLTLAASEDHYDFNQTKTKFSTYAYHWVYKYIYDTYWNENKRKDIANEAISLDGAISEYASNSKSSESDEGTMSNYLENHLDESAYASTIISTDKQVAQNGLNNIYKALQEYALTGDFSDFDRTVFNGLFVENQTVRQLSSAIGVPKKKVEESQKKIATLMQKKLSKDGIKELSDIL